MQFWVKMDPKSRRDLRKLIRSLRNPDKLVERLGDGLSRAAAEQMLQTVRDQFRSAGHEDLAESVQLVEHRDGSGIGVGVFPKQAPMSMSDMGPKDAVYVFSLGHESDEGKVSTELQKHNPWYGPELPFLPHRGEAITIVRRVRGDEAEKLKMKARDVLPGVKETMREFGVQPVSERKEQVWVDVGFFGQRLEFGLDGSELRGMWRRALREAEDLPLRMASTIEGVLFEGKSWSLTSPEDPRTMGPSEERAVVEFQRNIKG